MEVFLLILQMITFIDKSHFLIPQDYMGPGFNWVTHGIQLFMIYLCLSLHLPPPTPIQPQSTYHRKCPKCTVGGDDTIFLKTPGKFLCPTLLGKHVRHLHSGPVCWISIWKVITKFSLAKLSIFFPAAHPVTTWQFHILSCTLTSETIH